MSETILNLTPDEFVERFAPAATVQEALVTSGADSERAEAEAIVTLTPDEFAERFAPASVRQDAAVAHIDLSENAINSANAASHFDAGSALAREAEAVYQEGLTKMRKPYERGTMTERQQTILESLLASWKELVEKAYNDIISRRASWMPWTVCGPARYDSRKNNERADRQMQAAMAWNEKMDNFITNTLSMIEEATPVEQVIAEFRSGKRSETIASDDPHAAEKLAARIAYLKEDHERMKERNAYWRKHKTMKGFPGLSDAEADKVDKVLNDPQSVYHVPYAPYQLQLSGANIKRLEQRLKTISSRVDSADSEQVCKGFTVRTSAQSGRVNITFDDKPEADARDILKKNGFHWSPREQAWTRKATENALYAVKHYVIPALRELDAYREEPQQKDN